MKKISNEIIDKSLCLALSEIKLKCYEVTKAVGFSVLGIDWLTYSNKIDETAYEWIKHDISQWNDYDIFCLSASIYLHKVGLLPINNEMPIDTYSNHHIYSKKYILNYSEHLGVPEVYKDDIAWVCYASRAITIQKDNDFEENKDIKIKKGQRTKGDIACYLGLLARIGVLDIKIPNIFAKIYFKNQDSLDFIEYQKNIFFSGIRYIPSLKNNIELIISLRSTDKVVKDLNEIKKFINTTNRFIRSYIRISSFGFFGNNKIIFSIDEQILKKEIYAIVENKEFLVTVNLSIKLAIDGLLEAINPKDSHDFLGWGPEYNEDKYKSGKDSRIANTSEVLLAIIGFLSVQTSNSEEYIHNIISILSEVINSLEISRSKIIHERQIKISEEIKILSINSINKDKIEKLKKDIEFENKYKPFVSLTHKTPTIRANSLALLALSELIKNNIFTENENKNLIKKMLQDCMYWICNSSNNIFTKKVDELVKEEFYYYILALKALVRYNNIIVDDDSFDIAKLRCAASDLFNYFYTNDFDKWPHEPFQAMTLEILIWIYKKDKNQEIKHIITDIIENLFSKLHLSEFELWHDLESAIYDEGKEKSVRWTHITTAWAIEGFCLCYEAHLLNEKQMKDLLCLIPFSILEQKNDGFFGVYEPNKKSIYKTALYTYSLTRIAKLIESELC